MRHAFSTKNITDLPHFLQRIQAHNDWYNKRLLVGQLVHCLVDYHLRRAQQRQRQHGDSAWEEDVERDVE